MLELQRNAVLDDIAICLNSMGVPTGRDYIQAFHLIAESTRRGGWTVEDLSCFRADTFDLNPRIQNFAKGVYEGALFNVLTEEPVYKNSN